MRGYLIDYIDATFYNMTALALHNWRTYAEMRILASEVYQLNGLTEYGLPSSTLDQVLFLSLTDNGQGNRRVGNIGEASSLC